MCQFFLNQKVHFNENLEVGGRNSNPELLDTYIENRTLKDDLIRAIAWFRDAR